MQVCVICLCQFAGTQLRHVVLSIQGLTECVSRLGALTKRQDNELLEGLDVFNLFKLVAEQGQICELDQLLQTL